MTFDATEFPFMGNLSKREVPKVASAWDQLKSLRAQVEKYGPAVAPHHAAKLLGVSRQRIHQLMNDGRFLIIYSVEGDRYIGGDSLEEFAKLERNAGRPKIERENKVARSLSRILPGKK